jgi:hypothetical protein
MNEISRLAKALVDQIRQTKLFCASESCVNNRGSGECALRV